MNLELIADYACTCGEGPAWHPLEKRVYWTDIETGRMFRYDPATQKHEQFYTGPRVGGYTFQPDGAILLFRDKGNIALWKDGKVVKTIVESLPEERAGRFNDVIADPEGRVFCGTLTDGPPHTGRLYLLERDGSIQKIRDGVKVCNGMGFSPDLKTFYFTDTIRGTIFQFAYERRDGALTREKVFVQVPENEGWPDGMTVDAGGDVWSTRWDGHLLVRYGPDGKEKDRVKFPCKKVSSCAFAGEDYADLYVTTAGGDDKKENGDTAGALYRVRPGVKGRAEFFSRVRV
jgi:D-xylonolactonase